jgi:hypothetical protein
MVKRQIEGRRVDGYRQQQPAADEQARAQDERTLGAQCVNQEADEQPVEADQEAEDPERPARGHVVHGEGGVRQQQRQHDGCAVETEGSEDLDEVDHGQLARRRPQRLPLLAERRRHGAAGPARAQ